MSGFTDRFWRGFTENIPTSIDQIEHEGMVLGLIIRRDDIILEIRACKELIDHFRKNTKLVKQVGDRFSVGIPLGSIPIVEDNFSLPFEAPDPDQPHAPAGEA